MLVLWMTWAACDGGKNSLTPPAVDMPTGDTGESRESTPDDTGSVDLDLDDDGWSSAGGDCDDSDPDRFPGAPESSGDGIDSDCDGWDAPSLGSALGVTAQAQELTWLQFGHALDIEDIDADGDADIFVGSQHINYYGGLQGAAVLLEGSDLTQTAVWEGSTESATARVYGWDVGIMRTELGPQLAFLGIYGFWVVTPDTPSGDPEAAGGIYIANDTPDGFWSGARLATADVTGTPDDDVILECASLDGDLGNVCLVAGPVVDPDNLSNATVIVAGGPGLGSGLAGADVDGDGRGDLILGASNAQGEHGEISVLLGPVPQGRADVIDAHRSWVGENPGDWLGQVVSEGDLDGDGVDEVVGAAMAWPDNERRGRVYGLGLDTLDVLAAGFVVDGDERQHLGMGLATGDVDGDGQDDLAIGGPSMPIDPSVPGHAYVFFGPVAGALATADADVAFVGEAPGDGAGVAVAIGDVDGSGVADLVISAPYNDEAQIDSGKIYLVPGPLGP